MPSWEPTWWDRWPGRLDYELKKLEAAGYRLESTDQVRGLLELELRAPGEKTGIGELALIVTFPDTYPSTAPQVRAPALELRHHQHPFGHVLCLIGRSTTYWDSTSHLAELLDQQLRKAIDAGAADQGQGQDELDQAEPFASYYTYTEGLEFLLDDTEATMPSEGAGELTLLIGGPLPPIAEPGGRTLGLIDTMRSSGTTVHQASEGLRGLFGHAPTKANGRWVVLDAPVRHDDAEAIWRAAAAADPHGLPAAGIPGADIYPRLIGFPDEVSRTDMGISWVVVVRELGKMRKRTSNRISGHPARAAQAGRTPDTYYLGRVDRAGVHSLTARTPLTAPASSKSVLVLGCGAIGSVLIDQLARAGVGRFTLVDKHDTLEPGNLTRHAGSFHGTGLHKAIAMSHHVRAINPHAEVMFASIPVGMAFVMADGTTGGQVLADLMTGVDLVVDATAEVGVQEISADMARALGKPWVMLSASEGAAGGTVVRVDPDADWCFACFQWQRATGTIPFPVAVATENVQPVGCAEPTFVGAGFDLAEVSLQAARVAIGRLLRHESGAYLEDGHDSWILALRSEQGELIPPNWQGYALERHPSCRAHD